MTIANVVAGDPTEADWANDVADAINELQTSRFHQFRRASTYQSINDSTETDISWDTEDYDPYGLWTSGVSLTIPSSKAGWWRVNAVLKCQNDIDALVILKMGDFSGTPERWYAQAVNGGYGSQALAVSGALFLNVGDAIRVAAYQTSGGAQNVNCRIVANLEATS
jgi:hypothetical protein